MRTSEEKPIYIIDFDMNAFRKRKRHTGEA